MVCTRKRDYRQLHGAAGEGKGHVGDLLRQGHGQRDHVAAPYRRHRTGHGPVGTGDRQLQVLTLTYCQMLLKGQQSGQNHGGVGVELSACCGQAGCAVRLVQEGYLTGLLLQGQETGTHLGPEGRLHRCGDQQCDAPGGIGDGIGELHVVTPLIGILFCHYICPGRKKQCCPADKKVIKYRIREKRERSPTMKLSFFGADQCVTGSCHCLEVNGKRILIDCGLQQGRDEIDNASLPFHPGSIDYVLITHAHIDHSGRVPLLIKEGFQGEIVTTRVTAKLLDIMLQDSAHIQESDAQYKNRKNERAGREAEEPLYTVADAMRVPEFIHTCEYGEEVDLCEGVKAVFIDAGHLLGSASIKLTLTEDGETRTIVFSGDIGNVDQPIIRDPEFFTGADYVVMESTYGDRNHTEVWSYTDELAEIIDDTLGKGGNVVIPAFAVGRTQELLYFIREIKDRGLVTSVKDFPVYVDSPLAKAATTIFCGDLRGYLDEEALDLVQDGTSMFSFPGLRLTETTEESKLLNTDTTPKVIISASGMCDAGRIRHHLKYNLWRPDSAVVFVGYQAEGTLGRHLLDGAESVKLFGEEVAIRARIVNFPGLSSHADRDHLLDWICRFKEPRPQHVFVVHGDREVVPVFVRSVEEMGFDVHAPQYTEEYDLITCRQTAAGYLPRPRTRAFEGAPKHSAAYQRLVQVGETLAALIRRSSGRDNKSLAAFAEALAKITEKFNF